MSLKQLLSEAEKLPAKDRSVLASYLAMIERREDADWKSAMRTRLAEIKSGRHLTRDEVRGLARGAVFYPLP